MGKSDPVLFEWYLRNLQETCGLDHERVIFLGFPGESSLTRRITSRTRSFHDLSSDGWDINSRTWKIDPGADLVVCTRCAYFSGDPESFLERCTDLLRPGGHLLVDWGLGDHWRFPDFRVGWRSGGTHEYQDVGDRRSHLQSAFWRDGFDQDPTVSQFFSAVLRRPEYGSQEGSLSDIVEREVPVILDASRLPCQEIRISHLFLWPDSPQLYTLLVGRREEQ